MFEHYEDLYQSMKEISCEAEMLLYIGMRLTKRITGQDNVVDSAVMETLTSLYITRENYDNVKTEYKQRKLILQTKHQFDEAVEYGKLERKQEVEQRDAWMQQWRIRQNKS